MQTLPTAGEREVASRVVRGSRPGPPDGRTSAKGGKVLVKGLGWSLSGELVNWATGAKPGAGEAPLAVDSPWVTA